MRNVGYRFPVWVIEYQVQGWQDPWGLWHSAYEVTYEFVLTIVGEVTLNNGYHDYVTEVAVNDAGRRFVKQIGIDYASRPRWVPEDGGQPRIGAIENLPGGVRLVDVNGEPFERAAS